MVSGAEEAIRTARQLGADLLDVGGLLVELRKGS